MKKISIILAIVFIFAVFIGCVGCNSGLPRYSELRNIKIGTPIKDITEKYGDSKNCVSIIESEEGGYNFYMIYDTFEGKQIGIRFIHDQQQGESCVAGIIDIEPVEKSELPTYEKLSQITKGMSTKDVISEYGQSQRFILKKEPSFMSSSPADGYCPYWVYDSCDGMSVGVMFDPFENKVIKVITLSPDDIGDRFIWNN